MVTRRRVRRIGIAPPQLAGQLRLRGITGLEPEVAGAIERSWDEAVRTLQNFLKYIQDAADDGLPAGAYEDKPETVRAGHLGAVGDPGMGWSPGSHDHQVLVIPPVELGNALAEGTAEELVRGDHVHKRDVRVKGNGTDVATRNALDFRPGPVVWTLSDDPGNDEVDVAGGLSDDYAFITHGGTLRNPTGALDVLVWEAPFPCDVVAVRARREGGTGATVNMRKNGTLEHLASDLSLTTASVWTDGGSVQNAGYVAGDSMEVRIKSAAGSPTQVAVLARLRRTG
jgi:hypothetical protein